MANSTYLELVNKTLIALNEVELVSDSSFDSVKGLHAQVKNSVVYAVDYINHAQFKWPFNLVENQSQLLTAGVEAYSFPSDFKVADWDSFYIQKDDSLDIETIPLVLASKNEWARYGKPKDLDSEADGRDIPRYVVPISGNQFVVTPSPDETYTVVYNYWKEPTRLSTYSDVTTIPVEWDYVIILGALWHMNLFKENPDGVNLVDDKFEKTLAQMARILIHRPTDMNSGLIPRKRFSSTAGYYWDGFTVS